MGKKRYAYINPQMLIWARSETPFNSPEEVESYSSTIKADDLRKWESGEELPSITEAKKLAHIYKLPFASFYLSEEPSKRVKSYVDRRSIKGMYSGGISYSLWSEIRRVESVRDSVLEYADEDILTKEIPLIENDNISKIAIAIRDYLKLETPLRTKAAYGSNPFNYYRDIIERCGIIVTQLSGIELEEMKGLSIYHEAFPIIAINNKDFDRSKVFSLFHELAHIFRRSSSLCTIDYDEHSDLEEEVCDRIAAKVLMPDAEIKRIAKEWVRRYHNIDTIVVDRIAGRFGVSTLSALRRMKETGIVSQNDFFRLLNKITEEYNATIARIEANRKGKNIPVYYHVKYLNQNGSLFPKGVLNAYTEGNITYGEACKALGINSKHLLRIEKAVMYK